MNADSLFAQTAAEVRRRPAGMVRLAGLCALCLLLCWSAAGQAVAGEKILLFGTVEFKRPLNTLPAWLDLLRRNAASPIFQESRRFNASTTWGQLRGKAARLSPLEQCRLVNVFWNRWPYRTDSEVYGRADYWATPAEFLKKSGDCEDYAIAKYFTLKELGIPAEDMRVVVLRETIRNIGHAVLVVYLSNDAWVLDNLSNNVLSHTRYKNYQPQFSVNESGRWAHVQTKKSPGSRSQRRLP